MADGGRKRRFDEGPPMALGGARKQRIDLSELRGSGPGGVADSSINPYTFKPYSQRYFEILSKRRGLPVYEFLDELLTKVKKNQVSFFAIINDSMAG